MPPKRNASETPGGTPAKVPKTETRPEDFSNSVKRRLQSSTRTGQACDRCKIRKIRCDGLPGGCSPCLQNQTECRTTDRITGRAAPRGYVENIENHNRELVGRVRELEQILMQHGVDVKPAQAYHDQNATYHFNGQGQNGQGQPWNAQSSSTTYASGPTNNTLGPTQPEANMFRALPNQRTAVSGDTYLGVSTSSSHLSSIKGTRLSILGMEIDIADFTSNDLDEPDDSLGNHQIYNKSYLSSLQSALGVNSRIEKVDLPAREDGLTYAQWYFRVINPYAPILHKGTFIDMLTRIYDDPSFRPTVAQSVMVHMVFAIMFFQYATRNWENTTQQTHLNNQSNLHYHYSLGLLYQLVRSHTIEDAQALTLICAHLRNFPKPGVSWVLTNATLVFAIELGLHRSAKHQTAERVLTPLEIEMRKRVFWSILSIHVILGGKLGRPIFLRSDDFDVEYPQQIDDDDISETSVDASRPDRCLHAIGIAAYKLLPLYMEMYGTVYAVRRRPEMYIEMVNSLEARLQQWIEELPPDLVKGDSGNNREEGRVFALYTQSWALEFRMLLRHPSTSMTLDANFNAENMRVSLESARKMLAVVTQLQKLKSLDTTWYQSAVYVMAITTTLFAQWEKRNEMTAADLADLRSEMDMWLNIMGEIGALLGSGTRLRESVRTVTDGTLGLLSHSLLNKGSDFAPPTPDGNPAAAQIHRKSTSDTPANANGYHSSNYTGSFSDSNASANGSGATTNYGPTDHQLAHQQTPYPAATQYSSYPDPQPSTNALQYPQSESHSFSAYPSTAADSVEAPLLAAFATQASQVAQQQNSWQRPPSHNGTANPGSQSWQQWTSTMAGNLEPQDRYSASALMQLGGRDLTVGDNTGSSAPIADMAGAQMVSMGVTSTPAGGETMNTGGVTWPLNIFDLGQSAPPS
ncbi:MAG: hypothetical protein M1818_003626 [Claussenomyces sp. TS43310]|nr:MAG: hypothetical protein M1818_003626 [Claussenomyces sp. TS43310]